MGILTKKRLETSAKHLGLGQNVSIRVLDASTYEVVAEHQGHNSATNGMLTGIGHYLTGDGILNQGWHMLKQYVPQYISIGTMGLLNQEMDEDGYPAGIGVIDGTEEERFMDYIRQRPSFGADGYDANENNNRKYFGLGPMFSDRTDEDTINCELITEAYPRQLISYRDVVPETEAEVAKSIDVVLSAMIPLATLNKFKPEGSDYLFITEAGLWSRSDWIDAGDNGLLAGYRIAPPNVENWDMSIQENRDLLKKQILCVGKNQVVQVIWKIQLGAIEELTGLTQYYPEYITEVGLYWEKWGEDNTCSVEFCVHTYDDEKEALSGIKLQLVDSLGEDIFTWTTSNQSRTIDGLYPDEEYTVQEIEAPVEYSNSNLPITFTAKDEMVIDIMYEKSETPEISTLNIKIRLVDENDDYIEGAVLKILDESGNDVEEWTTEADEYEVDLLVDTNYILHETDTPDGYESSEDIAFNTSEVTSVTMMNKKIDNDDGERPN